MDSDQIDPLTIPALTLVRTQAGLVEDRFADNLVTPVLDALVASAAADGWSTTDICTATARWAAMRISREVRAVEKVNTMIGELEDIVTDQVRWDQAEAERLGRGTEAPRLLPATRA